jgi:hypothetical protein
MKRDFQKAAEEVSIITKGGIWSIKRQAWRVQSPVRKIVV